MKTETNFKLGENSLKTNQQQNPGPLLADTHGLTRHVLWVNMQDTNREDAVTGVKKKVITHFTLTKNIKK